ncbi:MAG: hypothetical protein KDB84_06240 [Flavobacteriales bacterium]|nr:hypothetical protein [Flavobacteriales bacterium]
MGYLLQVLAVPCALLTASLIHAQDPAPQRTLEWGNISFHCNGADQIVVDHHDAIGRYRRDVLPLEAIDLSAIGSPNMAGSLELVSHDDCDHCFRQEEFRTSTIRRSGRLILRPVAEEGSTLAGSDAVVSWIARLQEHSLLSETSTR